MVQRRGKTLTAVLLDVLEHKASELSCFELNRLVEHAWKNKISLHFLRALNFQGTLREIQESRIRRTIQVVQTISAILKSYDYAFFKLTKPVAYVPADVDLLIDSRQAGEAAREVMRLGYRVAVKDPYCITLTKFDSIVDLYTHPSLGGAVFIDGQKLLEHKAVRDFSGVEIRTLETYAEALVAAAHAVYKERIYTLNDYFTTEKWTSKRTLKLAQESKCENAVKTALNLNREIRQGLLETPYRIPATTWFTILLRKLREDHLTRATSTNVVKTLTSKRAGKLLMSKLIRETY